MEPLESLDRSVSHLLDLIGGIGPEQWGLPTPCTDWDVTDLVGHVIATTAVYRDLLHGAPADEVLVAMEYGNQRRMVGEDPLERFRAAVAALRDAFSEPGAMERVVHHPIGDIPGAHLLGIRVSENVIHGWDLATALGADAALDEELVAAVYERMAPMAASFGGTPYFARARPVAADAPLQQRLLALVGR